MAERQTSDNRKNIKASADLFRDLNEEREHLGLTWEEYLEWLVNGKEPNYGSGIDPKNELGNHPYSVLGNGELRESIRDIVQDVLQEELECHSN